jgi:hypothetical protein
VRYIIEKAIFWQSLLGEEAYRAAVSDINAALQGSNIEATRAALRSLLGNIPVFQTGRQLASRLTISPETLTRNPGNVLLVASVRSMASTLLNERGFPPDVIVLQSAHAERNKVRAAYNKAQRLPERRKMMQAWADYLDALRERARNGTDLRQVWP